MKDILNIKTVHQCNCCLGSRTWHPQASVIRLDNTNVEQHSIQFDFYTILLIENEMEDCCCCGRKYYDYSNATMVFLPPRQAFDMTHRRVLPQKGWLLAFHPDLLYSTTLYERINLYTFFFYRKEEALHLSLREKSKAIECLQEIDNELHHPIDRHSRTLISRYIELLLDYCTRFYDRQFITREDKNKVLVAKLDALLDDYIYSGKLKTGALPSSEYCAEHLKLSVYYFDDLLKFETGKNLKEYFQLKRLESSKKMLLDANNTPAKVANLLGFTSVQHFSMLFKKLTGVSADNYKITHN